MTDYELVSLVLTLLDPGAGEMRGLRRGGRLLMALPVGADAAERALRLYQPQRLLARGVVMAVRGLIRVGLQKYALSRVSVHVPPSPSLLVLDDVESGSCGMLLGSPEHKVRRAIASYRRAGQWEVAKISFGAAGADVLKQEAEVLSQLHTRVRGVPQLLGLHCEEGVTLLRMPYLSGSRIAEGESSDAFRLLHDWMSGMPPRPASGFPEWQPIEAVLEGCEAGRHVLGRLTQAQLMPVIRHGDFARWNLLKSKEGELVVLDWEWGHAMGMPGLDLVHYFLQDLRLVQRLSATEAVTRACSMLRLPASVAYLEKTGWQECPLMPIIACLAFKQGAGHQDNSAALHAALTQLEQGQAISGSRLPRR